MPKEAKKRGRRAEKKRKEEREADELKQGANFVPIEQPEEAEVEAEYYDDGAQQHPEDTPFHGLLTTEESEYFRNVDEVLEANAFSDPDERNLFIANVYREASGKELKLASSQGCSRLLEKLVQLSTPAQLKRLWRAFSGHFVGLVQHRFASHCCEVLFERSVVVAGKEMQKEYREEEEEVVEEEGGEPWASMESLFLYMLNEIEPEIIPLLTHTFASHPIRALLLILSGQPAAASPSSQSLVQSRKKRNISVATADFAPSEAIEVPESFTEAAERIVAAVGAHLGVEQIRTMAVHPIGGPTLQVLLQVEMQRPRGKGEATLLGKLAGIGAGDEEEEEGEEGEKKSSFFSNLLYDPVGSHLAEKIMSYAPKREFRKLYKAHFRTRMGSLARNETAGFVVVRVLEKVGREVLKEAVGEILKEVPGMIERGQVAVIKTLIDVCGKQEVDVADISKAIFSAYDCPSSQLIFKMLSLTPEELVPPPIEEGKEPPKPKRDPKQRHGSLLAQCLLHHPGDLHDTVSASLVSQSPDTTVGLCQHAQASHVVQAFLLSPHTTAPEKRKLLNGLRGSWAALTVHPSGSHIADAAWTATAGGGLTNYRQAIAAELLGSEPAIRESFFGRAVWRNWAMDKYKTRRNEWFGLAKEEASGASSLASGVGGLRIGGGGAKNGATAAQGPGPGKRQQGERKKTAIELARERHAAKNGAARTTSGQPKSSPGSGSGSGSNALAPPLPPPTKRQRVV